MSLKKKAYLIALKTPIYSLQPAAGEFPASRLIIRSYRFINRGGHFCKKSGLSFPVLQIVGLPEVFEVVLGADF